MEHIFDVAIVGGGINGCGCAADAALRGLSVVLFEQDDLASQTSSKSTKLIHGGLRYLEYYEFSLVKKALEERQTLLSVAPHLVHSQAFMLPYQKHMRPAWFLRLGLFIYDHLNRSNRLPHCQSMYRKKNSTYFQPLDKSLNKGFLFYDAATDDARLTISNALQAKNYGASIRPRSKLIKTECIDGLWQLSIQAHTGLIYQIHAKTIINATGPWVEHTAQLTQTTLKHPLALVKGSHIVVPKLYEEDQAYFLQHEDKRVVFVIPYHGYSMIGTTDVPFTDSPEQVRIDQQEIDYLINLVNSYFKTQINAKDIVCSWSGIRPLLATKNKNASSLSRDYSYELALTPAPIITILGGKITTYRQLAEEVINQLKPFFPQLQSSATKTTPLPGAACGSMDFEQYKTYAEKHYHWLNKDLLNRYLYSYGSRMDLLIGSRTSMHAMGKKYGKELYEAELDYLIDEEWAQKSEDILERRSKLGLNMSDASKKEVAEYINTRMNTKHDSNSWNLKSTVES